METSPMLQGNGTKSISAEELKEYLHLPAKEVAKNLGMCLTSLKKVCRQHGIRRWPYRRLKSIDKKIQNLESNMNHGVSDDHALKKQIEQLHSERASLPLNYGTLGSGRNTPDFDSSVPSSPLSCASTTVTDAIMVTEDHQQQPETPPSVRNVSPSSSCDSSPTLKMDNAPAPMTAAAALVSSLSPSAPLAKLSSASVSAVHKAAPTKPAPRPQAKPAVVRPICTYQAPAHQKPASAAPSSPPSTTSPNGQGGLKLEVNLPADVAALVAKGAQLVVEQSGGKTQLHVVSQKGSPPVISIDLASVTAQACREHLEQQQQQQQQQQQHQHQEQELKVDVEHAAAHSHDSVSDDDMINALVGCAAEKASVAPLQEQKAHVKMHEMTDEEIALALAGCVGTGRHDDMDTEGIEADKMMFNVDDQSWFDVSHHTTEEHYDMDALILPGFEGE